MCVCVFCVLVGNGGLWLQCGIVFPSCGAYPLYLYISSEIQEGRQATLRNGSFYEKIGFLTKSELLFAFFLKKDLTS